MHLKVLVDNNCFIDQYYLAEPALSFYIEDQDKKILFDTGYSDIFLKNSQKMGIDLSTVDYVILSHGHNDHSNGIKYLSDLYDCKNIKLIANDNCFSPKMLDGLNIGSPYSLAEVKERYDYISCDDYYQITDNLYFVTNIPREIDFEEDNYIGETYFYNSWHKDYLLDDSFLVYKSEKGLFIICGCAHCGICNSVEYACKLFPNENVYGIIGGFHLFKNDIRLHKTINYLKEKRVEVLYPSHCVSLEAKAQMMTVLNVKEVGVNLSIKI